MIWIIYDNTTLVIQSKHETEPTPEPGFSAVEVDYNFPPGQDVRNYMYDDPDVVIRTDEELEEELDPTSQYVDHYKGRIYVRKGRWYGLNPTYGEGYYNANYQYGRDDFDELPSLEYWKGVGSIPDKAGTLKRICISFARSSNNIDNLQLFVNKMTKTSGSPSVVNKTLIHEDTKAKGHNISSGRPYYIELVINEPVTERDVIMLLVNSSSNKTSTRYLYACEIKYIYE